MRQGRGWVALAAVAGLAGCAVLGGPRPAADAPVSDAGVVAIQGAADVGALCVLIQTEGSAADVAKAGRAVAAAQAVLLSPVPSFALLSATLSDGMPVRYAALSAIILQRVRARLGQAEVIPEETVAWAMTSEFLASCGSALGATRTRIQLRRPRGPLYARGRLTSRIRSPDTHLLRLPRGAAWFGGGPEVASDPRTRIYYARLSLRRARSV